MFRIHHIHILPALYGSVYITPEVYAEVAVTGAEPWGATEIAKADWIQVKAAEYEAKFTAEDRAALGAGEVSTILLVKQLKADVALMDDRRARAFALKQGVTPLGCVGILHAAFLSGLVNRLAESVPIATSLGLLSGSPYCGSKPQGAEAAWTERMKE